MQIVRSDYPMERKAIDTETGNRYTLIRLFQKIGRVFCLEKRGSQYSS